LELFTKAKSVTGTAIAAAVRSLSHGLTSDNSGSHNYLAAQMRCQVRISAQEQIEELKRPFHKTLRPSWPSLPTSMILRSPPMSPEERRAKMSATRQPDAMLSMCRCWMSREHVRVEERNRRLELGARNRWERSRHSSHRASVDTLVQFLPARIRAGSRVGCIHVKMGEKIQRYLWAGFVSEPGKNTAAASSPRYGVLVKAITGGQILLSSMLSSGPKRFRKRGNGLRNTKISARIQAAAGDNWLFCHSLTQTMKSRAPGRVPQKIAYRGSGIPVLCVQAKIGTSGPQVPAQATGRLGAFVTNTASDFRSSRRPLSGATAHRRAPSFLLIPPRRKTSCPRLSQFDGKIALADSDPARA